MEPLSLEGEDARDLELLRELKRSLDAYMNAAGGEKEKAKAEYLSRLKAFNQRLHGRHRPLHI